MFQVCVRACKIAIFMAYTWSVCIIGCVQCMCHVRRGYVCGERNQFKSYSQFQSDSLGIPFHNLYVSETDKKQNGRFYHFLM